MDIYNKVRYLLGDFEKNPYNTSYNIQYKDALSLLVSGLKSIVIFSHKYKSVSDNKFNLHYVTFAIKHAYHKPLQCNLYLHNLIVNTFTIHPNKVEWILNGIPIVMTIDDCFHIIFTETDDPSQIIDIECTTYDMTFDITLGREMLNQPYAFIIWDKFIVYDLKQYKNYMILDSPPSNCYFFSKRPSPLNTT
jgi:hypothetical protein